MSDEFEDLVPTPVPESEVDTTGPATMDDLPSLGPTLVPGTRAPCPVCAKELTVMKGGGFRQHTCDPSQKPKNVPAAAINKGGMSANARKFMVAGVAGTAQWGTAQAVSRYVPCPPQAVPAQIPDANREIMVGPLVDSLWPALPESLKTTLEHLADNTDLILCALAWSDYFSAIRKWARQEHKNLADVRERMEATHGVAPPQAPSQTHKGTDATMEVDSGNVSGDAFGGFQPFSPAE